MKLIVFDLDGTLINTAIGLNRCMNYALTKHGLPAISLSQTQTYVGNGIYEYSVRSVMQSYGAVITDRKTKELCDLVNADFSIKYEKDGLDGCVLYDGIAETLITLKKHGIKLAILSNKAQFATDIFYKTFLSDFDFDLVIGQREGLALKPAPDGLISILNSTGIDKDDALMVGDGETDYLAANGAGVKCLSALWGYRSIDTLKTAGSTFFITAPKEIIKYAID